MNNIMIEVFKVNDFLPNYLYDMVFNVKKCYVISYDINRDLFNEYYRMKDVEYTLFSSKYYGEELSIPCKTIENNHSKVFYMESKHSCRMIFTSCNLTYNMITGCTQHIVRITCKRKRNRVNNEFFDVFGFKIDKNMDNIIRDRIVYNIPNKNTIYEWYKKQSNILVDCNNVNFNSEFNMKSIFFHYNDVPCFNKTINYYNYCPRDNIIEREYFGNFHYKIYKGDSETLYSSNNFSDNYKNNIECGILI